MSADAIQQLTLALRRRLQAALRANGIDRSEEVYVGPLDDRDAMDSRIVLFLYRIAVNAELRNTAHERLLPNGETLLQEGALPLDLHFLLTAGSLQTGGELPSLHILGCAMQALLDGPVVAGVEIGAQTVRLSLEPLNTEEMSRVWSLFPTVNYRTSVAYLATPVWIDPARAQQAAPAVREEPHRVGAMERDEHAGARDPFR
jgi:hypothetical protein